jgi:hypothetical protein
MSLILLHTDPWQDLLLRGNHIQGYQYQPYPLRIKSILLSEIVIEFKPGVIMFLLVLVDFRLTTVLNP